MCTFVKYIICVIVLVSFTACQAKEQIVIKMSPGEWAAFFVDIADTPQSQERGLMFVDEMPEDEGMLFTYERPTSAQFWMKNTYISLDILFFDHENKLIYITRGAKPHDEKPVGPLTPVCSVLELNGGTAQEMKIEVGAQLITNITQECLQYLSE